MEVGREGREGKREERLIKYKGIPMWLNMAKFLDNGGVGYVLKPSTLLTTKHPHETEVRKTLHVHVRFYFYFLKINFWCWVDFAELEKRETNFSRFLQILPSTKKGKLI
jgi:hypothetical protein